MSAAEVFHEHGLSEPPVLQLTPRLCPGCGQVFTARYARQCRACRYDNLPGRPRRWTRTPELEADLRARYDGHVRGRALEIARSWRWPRWAVLKWAQDIGITRPDERGRSPEWTPEQLDVLERFAGRRSVDFLARATGRSRTAVIVKLKRLGISRRVESSLSANEVARLLGVDRKTVRGWIDRGWLRARRSTELRAGDDMRWEVSDEALRAFVRTHPMAFGLGRVDQVWFLEVVMGGLGECG